MSLFDPHSPRIRLARIRTRMSSKRGRPTSEQQRKRMAALATAAMLAAVWSMTASRPARAVEESVSFGAPTVLSQRGQRLKVVLPMQVAANDRATAAAFLVQSTATPAGYPAPTPQGFTVMRPSRSSYVVFQSEEPVNAPSVSLKFALAGDPKSPYQMDLLVPENHRPAADSLALREESAARTTQRRAPAVRRISSDPARHDLPAK